MVDPRPTVQPMFAAAVTAALDRGLIRLPHA
jgi:hypothetical protein